MPARSFVPRGAAAALSALICISCATDKDRIPPPPPAEFLFVAGDSTYWIKSDSAGIRVRGSAILLARVDGRFHEIYVADEDRSFYDAVFVGQRVYRRDLEKGDSLLVFDDATVRSLARGYAANHPNEVPLLPEEDGSDRPASVATTEVIIVDVHGPFLSYEYRADLDVAGGTDTHVMRRGVLDLRNGSRATLEKIFGTQNARRMADAGRRAQQAMQDSVRASSDPRASIASLSLDAFSFDPNSFIIADEKGEPVVAFAVPGTGPAAGGLALPLPSIRAPRVNWWADEVRGRLPTDNESDGTARWRRAGYEVIARYDSVGESVALALRENAPRRREWPLGRMTTPARRIFWLDKPGPGSSQRAALERAFDESAMYGGEVKTASRRQVRRQPVALNASWRQ